MFLDEIFVAANFGNTRITRSRLELIQYCVCDSLRSPASIRITEADVDMAIVLDFFKFARRVVCQEDEVNLGAIKGYTTVSADRVNRCTYEMKGPLLWNAAGYLKLWSSTFLS